MTTKVLVFESDASFAAELRSELSKLDCTVSVVDDGNAGLQAAADNPPDLILLSIELPRMNGFSVCNKLKKDPALKDVPLIIMSSESSEETFEQHRKLRTRAEAYVHKPLAFGELLQNIRAFVAIGGGDDASVADIVIDEEVEMGSDEVEEEATMMFARPDLQGLPPLRAAPARAPAEQAPAAQPAPARASVAPAAPQPKHAEVDADVDAFIEGGFGRLTSQAVPAEAAASPARRPTAPPPADTGKLAELERELAAARQTATQLRADFDTKIEAEQQKMERELDDLRAKLSAATKSGAPAQGAISSREFLDLREALNKKDKELLSLKESLSKKDREVFEARDKTLELERAKADVDDRVIATERALEDTKDRLDNATRDKEQAKKASEDLKARLVKAQSDVDEKLKEIDEAKRRATDAAAAHEASLSALSKEHDAVVARERAEAQSALDQLEAASRAAQEEAARQHASGLAETASQAARDKQEAIASREAELKAESDARLAALHRAQQDELAKARAEHTRQTDEAAAKHAAEAAATHAANEAQAAQAKAAADQALTDREGHLEDARKAQVAALEQERDSRLATLERERDSRIATLEQDRDSRIATLEQERDSKVAGLEGHVASLQADLRELTERKAAGDAASDARIADLAQQLAAAQQAREELDKLLTTSRERAAKLESENDALVSDLVDSKGRLETQSARAQKATAKWESDKASLDRAKSALAVALAQIEETETRELD